MNPLVKYINKKLLLGLIINENGHVQSHRTLLKVIINPIFRFLFKRAFATESITGSHLSHFYAKVYVIIKQTPVKPFKFNEEEMKYWSFISNDFMYKTFDGKLAYNKHKAILLREAVKQQKL